MDDFFAIALPASGTWQLDDSNQTDYPIITTNLVSGQRDYPFTTDGSGNLILDIYRVMVANSSGLFTEIDSVDQQTKDDNITNTDTFINGQNSSGIPTRYDKTGNSIFLDPIPNYNYSGGLKVHINREGSYFATSDTTKKPGVPGILHEYFVLKPALKFAGRKSLSNYKDLLNRVNIMEARITDYFGSRERDTKASLRANIESTR